MSEKGIFVTATGTDVGKTYVSGLLVKYLRQCGIDCGYYKPALSGAIMKTDGHLFIGDCEFVIKTSGLDATPQDCSSYVFEEAVSPHLAAMRQGVVIEQQKIQQDFNKISQQRDFVVVEGAGGITCPFNLLNEKLLLSDIIKILDLDIIIVADGGLGTINSVLLTVEYAKHRDINVKGIILNNYEPHNFMHIDNKNQIEKLTGIKVIATVQKDEKDIKINKEVFGL